MADLTEILSLVEKSVPVDELSCFNLHFRRYLETLQAIDKLLSNGHVLSNTKILDVGCYPGHLATAIKYMGFEVAGVDLLPDRISERMANRGIFVKQCDLESGLLPFPDGAFDCVLLTEVVEHLSTQKVPCVLQEAKRVLRAGGVLVLSTPNLATLDNRLLLLLGKELLIKDHNREYTMREVKSFLENAGFEVMEAWFSLCRDVVTHKIPDKFISKEHVLSSFLRPPFYYKNFARAFTLPLKMIKPRFRSIIFVTSKRPQR